MYYGRTYLNIWFNFETNAKNEERIPNVNNPQGKN